MENSPVVPGSPYFIMTYDTAKKLTGITEQTGILAVKNSDGHLDEVLTAVQEIADENGKIEVNMIEQTIKNIQHQYRASINALYMASAILFVFGSISLPLCVTACICFGILCSKHAFSETVAIVLCVIWSAVWLFIVLNENVYIMVTVPIWSALLGVTILFIAFAIYRILKNCNQYLEVSFDEIRA